MQDFGNRAHGVAREVSSDAIGDFYSMFHRDKSSHTPVPHCDDGTNYRISRIYRFGPSRSACATNKRLWLVTLEPTKF